MRRMDCPLCGSADKSELYPERLENAQADFDYLTESANHYRIVRCRACGMVYSDPVFEPERIIELYRNSRIDEAVKDSLVPSIRRNMARYVDRLVRVSGIRSGRVLDVGCGCGHLVEAAALHGFEAHGVDPSAGAVEHARHVLGLTGVRCADYSRSLFPEAYFDLVFFVHVIDHVSDPRRMLEDILYHLRPGGCALVATHNIGSLLARVQGMGFIAWSVQHLSYFDPASLRRMLEAAGFAYERGLRSLTTYPLAHYVENGIRNPGLRRAGQGVLGALGLKNFALSFPFGNIEAVGRKPRGAH